MTAPRYAYPVLVLGADRAPPELVAAKLELFTAAKAADHSIVLIPDGHSHSASDWSRTRDHCSVQLVPLLPRMWPRGVGLVRWAMEVAAVAEAAVLFGPDAPYRVVLRYLRDAAVPVRRVAIPAGHVAPAREERRVPWAFTPTADSGALLTPHTVLDGAGPGGYPD